MKTAADWVDHCADVMDRSGLFFGHGTSNAWDEAAWLVRHVLATPMDRAFEDWDTLLDPAQEAEVERLLERRITEKRPLAYLIGRAWFCGLEFIVTPDVLVPRSPLAELIRDGFAPWLQIRGEGRALDMCTGSGCIAIALARHLPGVAVDAVDISAPALAVAARNVALHGVERQVSLLQSDLFSAIPGTRYDLIVSNPPYVSRGAYERLPGEFHAEPALGLACGEDGLDIVLKILDASPSCLKDHGILVVEVGESAPALAEALPDVPFLWLEFEHGGDGVFLLEYEQLEACRGAVRDLLERRSDV